MKPTVLVLLLIPLTTAWVSPVLLSAPHGECQKFFDGSKPDLDVRFLSLITPPHRPFPTIKRRHHATGPLHAASLSFDEAAYDTYAAAEQCINGECPLPEVSTSGWEIRS